MAFIGSIGIGIGRTYPTFDNRTVAKLRHIERAIISSQYTPSQYTPS